MNTVRKTVSVSERNQIQSDCQEETSERTLEHTETE